MGKKKQESSSSSSSDESSSVEPPKKVVAPAKASPAPAKAKAPAKKKEESSDSSSSSSSEEVKKPVKKTPVKEEKKTPAKKSKKEPSSSSSDSDSESEEKPKPAPKATPKATPKAGKKAKASSSSESDSDSESEEKPKAKAKVNEKKRKADNAAEEPAAKKAKTEGAKTEGGNSRVFLGNLPFTIDDDQIKAVFKDAGEIVDIHWVTDRQTGKFYGTGFVEFASAEGAQKAVAMAGQDVGGRPMKVDFAQPKAEKKEGAATPRGERKSDRAPTPKPDGCTTVFLGNLSFNIDEDGVRSFFKDCGEITAIRWVERDGQFKGCGFVEFAESNSTDKAVAKNGQDLLGRAIRVDYSAPKPPREKRF